MTIKIHDLKPVAGSNRRKKRVGRGIAGKGGKTAGRGTKGQNARGSVPASFEGGQMPLHMRLPKLKGFNNPFRVEYHGINLDTIEESGLDEVSPTTLRTKGTKARYQVPAAFEGGQMPLHMRLPKLKGFNNPFRVEYHGINLDTIEDSGLDEVSPGTLLGKGLAHKGALVKVLGRGELTRKVTVQAHAFSKSAEAAIIAAGGTVEILPKPWGDRRPPVQGNQFANR